MRIAILTSSRADFGIYEVLIDQLIRDRDFELELIAFGTHVSYFHGYTLSNILDNYNLKVHEVCSVLVNDDAASSASSFGLTALKFADFWNVNKYNLVFCLGDRFEMCAAVQAGIPFGINFAHIHGGETTTGAVDNTYRHQISLACNWHFTSTESYKQKLTTLIGSEQNIFNVGSLSVSRIKKFRPLKKSEFISKYNLNEEPYCLVTFHSETRAFDYNKRLAMEMKESLSELSSHINLVVTMPNADTYGTEYRKNLISLKEENRNKVFLIENFGQSDYFNAVYNAQFILGNSSSGIIEAASLHKYVVNVGNRQSGRDQSDNVINVAFEKKDIIKASLNCLELGEYRGGNIYDKGETAKNIISIIKRAHAGF